MPGYENTGTEGSPVIPKVKPCALPSFKRSGPADSAYCWPPDSSFAAQGARWRRSRGLSAWLRVGLKKTPGACSSLLNGKMSINAATSVGQIGNGR